MKYEPYRPSIVREITWLKAMEEPMMMSERRQAFVVVRMTAWTGIDVRGSTCFFPLVSASGGGMRVVMGREN